MARKRTPDAPANPKGSALPAAAADDDGSPHAGPASRHPGHDAPKRKQLEYWLGHFSQYDLLTDLPNRSQFVDRLTGAIARAVRDERAVGVMLINLDGFKALNVEHGHRNADKVLKAMGARLKQCTRASDSIARLGGDEFSVILEGLIERDGAVIAADRVLCALRQPLRVGDRDVAVTATAGIAFFPLDAANIDVLLHRADVALSHAKDHRRGTCGFYSPDLALGTQRDQLRRNAAKARLDGLTPREREVLDILVAGNANKMIAYMLGTSIRTIENHRARIMRKMHAQSLPELVRNVLEAQGAPIAAPPRERRR